MLDRSDPVDLFDLLGQLSSFTRELDTATRSVDLAARWADLLMDEEYEAAMMKDIAEDLDEIYEKLAKIATAVMLEADGIQNEIIQRMKGGDNGQVASGNGRT